MRHHELPSLHYNEPHHEPRDEYSRPGPTTVSPAHSLVSLSQVKSTGPPRALEPLAPKDEPATQSSANCPAAQSPLQLNLRLHCR